MDNVPYDIKVRAVMKILKKLNVSLEQAKIIVLMINEEDGMIDTFISYLRRTKENELTGNNMIDFLHNERKKAGLC